MAEPVTSGRAVPPVSASPVCANGGAVHIPSRARMVMVPFVGDMLQSRTYYSVINQGFPVTFEKIPRGSKGDYAAILDRWWRRGSTFVVCEQDIVAPEGSILSLMTCQAPWCCHAHDVGHGPQAPMLGLVKFAGSLTRSDPDLIRKALWLTGKKRGWANWRSIDVRLKGQFEGLKVPWHVHEPPAEHLHRYTEDLPSRPAGGMLIGKPVGHGDGPETRR